MDVALCGGGDPNQGYTNTAVQLSSSAMKMVKAAIFMGDPLYRAGLSYDVGTCAAGGVCTICSPRLKFGPDNRDTVRRTTGWLYLPISEQN